MSKSGPEKVPCVLMLGHRTETVGETYGPTAAPRHWALVVLGMENGRESLSGEAHFSWKFQALTGRSISSSVPSSFPMQMPSGSPHLCKDAPCSTEMDGGPGRKFACSTALPLIKMQRLTLGGDLLVLMQIYCSKKKKKKEALLYDQS